MERRQGIMIETSIFLKNWVNQKDDGDTMFLCYIRDFPNI